MKQSDFNSIPKADVEEKRMAEETPDCLAAYIRNASLISLFPFLSPLLSHVSFPLPLHANICLFLPSNSISTYNLTLSFIINSFLLLIASSNPSFSTSLFYRICQCTDARMRVIYRLLSKSRDSSLLPSSGSKPH